MSLIEQAAKRLEQLRRGGVEVPWEAAGLTEERFDAMLGQARPAEAAPAVEPIDSRAGDGRSLLAAAVERHEAVTGPRSEALVEAPAAMPANPAAPQPASPLAPAATAEPPASRRSISVDLDLERLGRQGILVPSQVRSDLALEFRHIKRPLLRVAAERGEPGSERNSLIMITSAVPGEGKTYCAVNLAMSIAMEVDTSVLLVDADVVRPAVLPRLGLTERPGLMDVLMDDRLDLADVILRTNLPKLSLLPAGSRSAVATELLASAAMDRLLTELATRYPDRVVILDAPPLLLTTEARVLASRVGQVVIVVDSTHTTTARVAEAFATVEAHPRVVSVLNKSTDAPHKDAYGYGYDYR